MAIKITVKEFRDLPRQEQLDVIFTIGDYIETRLEESFQVMLYAVDRFFVEIYYDPITNKIQLLNPFISGSFLNKYARSLKGIV